MKTLNAILKILIDNWPIIAPVIYEILVRLIPTAKNWSIISLIFPNRRKPKTKVPLTLLFMLTSFGVFAQLDGTFKTLRLVNVADSTTVLPVNLTLYYNQQSHKPRIYYNNVWHDLGTGGGSGGGISNSAANTELMMSNGTNAIPSNLFKTNISTTEYLTFGNNATSGNRVISHQSSDGSATLTFSNAPTGGTSAIQFVKGNSNLNLGASLVKFYDGANFSNQIAYIGKQSGQQGLFLYNSKIMWGINYGGSSIAPPMIFEGAQTSSPSGEHGVTGPMIIKSGKAAPSGTGITDTGGVTIYSDSTIAGNSGIVNITTGLAATGQSGPVLISTGAAKDGSGTINIQSGNITDAGGGAGNVNVVAGNGVAGSTAGNVIVESGLNEDSGTSGTSTFSSHSISELRAIQVLPEDVVTAKVAAYTDALNERSLVITSDGHATFNNVDLNINGNPVATQSYVTGSKTFAGIQTFAGLVVFNPGATSNTLIIQSQILDPTSPVNGIWINSTSNQLRAHLGSEDRDVLSGYSATATLNFPSTAAGAVSSLTMTFTGAAVGDVIALGAGTFNASCYYVAQISSANTATIIFRNGSASAVDPASATFTLKQIK